MSTDGELEKWRRQWQGGAANASRGDEVERLRRRVLRETRWIKLGMIAPVLVTIGIGGGVVLRALRTEQTFDVVLAIESWAFIVVVWIVSLSLARGTWRPLGETTAAFVDLSIRRREANLRAATFAAWAYVIQLLVVVIAAVAISVDIGAALTSWQVIVLGWVGLPSFLAAVYWFRRSQSAELARLQDLKRQLQGD